MGMQKRKLKEKGGWKIDMERNMQKIGERERA